MRNGVKHISSLRISFSEKNKKLITLLVLLIVLFVSALAGICLGSVRLSPSEVFTALASGKSTSDGRIVYCIRLPRVLGSMLAGAALALSGAIIQAVLGNPLASPGVIGVNAGAGFFTVLCSALLPTAAKMLPAAAFVGAFAAVMTVYIIARRTEASKLTLVLAGAAISSLFNAGTDTVTELFPETLSGISSFKIGGIGNITLEKLFPAWIIIAVGIAAAFLLHNETDVLSLGDKTAFTLGLNVKATRFVLLIIAAALAGAAVDLPTISGEVGDLRAARAVAVACGCDGADFLRPNRGLGAGDDTVEGRENHRPAEVGDEDGSDLELGHVLEGGGGVGVLGGHRGFLSFGACSLSTPIE